MDCSWSRVKKVFVLPKMGEEERGEGGERESWLDKKKVALLILNKPVMILFSYRFSSYKNYRITA